MNPLDPENRHLNYAHPVAQDLYQQMVAGKSFTAPAPIPADQDDRIAKMCAAMGFTRNGSEFTKT